MCTKAGQGHSTESAAELAEKVKTLVLELAEKVKNLVLDIMSVSRK